MTMMKVRTWCPSESIRRRVSGDCGGLDLEVIRIVAILETRNHIG